jgi:outer membrane receptor protein involved in Fe transport
LSLSQFESDPRQSLKKDESTTTKSRTALSLNHQQKNWQFAIDAYTEDNLSNSQYQSFGSYRSDTVKSGFQPRVNIDYALGDWGASTKIGLDRQFSTNQTSYNLVKQSITGHFVQQTIQPSERWEFQLGYRTDELSQQKDIKPTVYHKPKSTHWRIAYTPNSNQQYWLISGKSHRLPEAFENSLTENNELLNVQKSKDLSLGGQWTFGQDIFKAEITRHKITDEIAYLTAKNYGLFGGYNTNLPPTKHQGFELSYRWHINDQWRLDSSYSYIRAKFSDGATKGNINLSQKDIPEVPRHSAKFALNWQINEQLSSYVQANYKGTSHLGGDWQNQGQKKPSLLLLDVGLQQQIEHQKYTWQIEAGIKNLMNRSYYSSAYYDNISQTISVYPERKRELFVGVKLKF